MREGFCRAGMLGCAVAGAASALAASALAGESTASTQMQGNQDSSPTIEQVIVTARRRDERLIDVPVTATTFNPQQLARYNTEDLNDLSSQVPTLYVSPSGGAGAGGSIALRGIAGSGSDAGIEQTVAVNIDGVQTSRGRIVSLGLLDLANVEVLLGPQSLFFGKNSPGGVISFSSTNPGDRFEGYMRASYAFVADNPSVEGAVSIPLTDTLSIRLAARYDQSDGYTTNQAVPHPGFLPGETGFTVPPSNLHPAGYTDALGRITVLWRPNDRLDVNFKFLGSQRNDNSATGASIVLTCAPGNAFPETAGRPDLTGDCNPRDRKVSVSGIPSEVAATMPFAGNGVPYNDVSQYLSSLNVNYTLGPIKLTSVTGLYYEENQQFDGFDDTSLSQFDGSAHDINRTFSEELRASSSFAGPLNFTTGVYYSHDSRVFSQVVKLVNPGPDPATGRYYDAQSVDYNSNDTYSVFGEMNWKIVRTVELAAGARYTDEEKNGSVRNIYVNPNVPAFYGLYLPAGTVVGGSISANNVSPEVTLRWKPTPDVSFYGAYKTGYLSPGFSNPGNLNALTSFHTITFGAETAKGGEIGAKGQFFGGRVTADFSLYDYDFSGLQATSFDTLTDQYVTKNVGEAKTEGGELQGSARLTREFSVRLAVAYTHAYYISFPNADCYAGEPAASPSTPPGQNGVCYPEGQSLNGLPFAGVAPWTVNYGASWDHRLTSSLMIGLTADAYFESDYNWDGGFRPGHVQPAFTRLDLSARLYAPEKGWELALILRNITDTFYIIGGGDKVAGAVGDTVGAIGNPAEAELQLTYRFR